MPTFYYSVVRYVPDVVRDEGINIGVVLEEEGNGRKREYLFADNYNRAAKLDPHFKGRALERLLEGSVHQIAEEAGVDGLRLSDLVANYSGTRVQLTEPRITIADDAKSELEGLYARFIFEERGERAHGKSDQTLKKEVRDVFIGHGIDHERLRYSTHKQPIRVRGLRTTHGFDMSVSVNGHQNLFRCISFDVDDYLAKVDAAKILTYDSRDVMEALAQVEIISVLQPPIRNPIREKTDAFVEARAILQDEGVAAFDFASNQDREQLLTRVK